MECRSADVTVGGIVRGQVVSVHLRSTPRRPSAWVFRSGGANPPGLAGLAVGMGGACPLHLTSHPVTSARAMRANITTPKHHPPGAESRARDGAPWVETRPLGVEPRLPGLESRSSPAISAIPMRTGPTQPPPPHPEARHPATQSCISWTETWESTCRESSRKTLRPISPSQRLLPRRPRHVA